MGKEYDYLIVGSGLFGACFAYLANSVGKKCLVIEKKKHVGGNIYCENIEGINVHKYGAHIFHTSDKNIWDFVNSFVEFNRYTNSPIANYKGEYYNLPFNMNTFHQLWGVTTPEEAKMKIEDEKKNYSHIIQPQNLEEQALVLAGKDIYEKLIKGYTEKQWGRACTEIPAFIIRRLPFRFTFDNNYFNDKYQGIPVGGYNNLINGFLTGIKTTTNVNFFENIDYWKNKSKKIIFTGKIDEFYNYKYGELAYRSLIFEEKIIDNPNFQGNAVVNYTERDIPFTRIIEHKHFESFGEDIYKNPKTIITKEYPSDYNTGMDPYYPINDKINNDIYTRYKSLAEKEGNVIFGGRLAEYKYYDMHNVIERAFEVWEKEK